jgi:hypothetical protein
MKDTVTHQHDASSVAPKESLALKDALSSLNPDQQSCTSTQLLTEGENMLKQSEGLNNDIGRMLSNLLSYEEQEFSNTEDNSRNVCVKCGFIHAPKEELGDSEEGKSPDHFEGPDSCKSDYQDTPIEPTSSQEESTAEEEEGVEGFVAMTAAIKKHVKEWTSLIHSSKDLTFSRLNGNSNACYKVTLKNKAPYTVEFESVLFRRYEQDIIDKKVEQAIFKAAADAGIGPKMFYQDDKFRIEGFFNGRPITLWEMRNPVIASTLAKEICDFNFNEEATRSVQNIEPLDYKNLFIHQVISKWGSNLQAKLPAFKQKLRDAATHESLKKLEQAERLEKTFLFEGYKEHFNRLVPIPGEHSHFDRDYVNPFPVVLTHNDAH